MNEVQDKRTRVFAFIMGRWGDDYSVGAVSEDGQGVAGHVSSSPEFAKADIGFGDTIPGRGNRKRYDEFFPDGYKLEWIDDPAERPDVLAAIKLNHIQAGEKVEADA